MISISELGEILKAKIYSADMKRTVAQMGVPVAAASDVMQPYLHIDYLVSIIQRETGFKITEVEIKKLKAKQEKRGSGETGSTR